MLNNHTDTFFTRFEDSCGQKKFIKLTLSVKRDKGSELKNVFVKPVMLKAGWQLSFVYRYPAKDVTKNYSLDESLMLLRSMLNLEFFKADLFTTESDLHLTIHANGKSILLQKKPTATAEVSLNHDKVKQRQVQAAGNTYLQRLGVTTADGKVKSDKQDKYRQINKYVEIVDGIVNSSQLPGNMRVVDMGAGKGYLTFALYDHLANTMKMQPEITGVELRQELVERCNEIAKEAGFARLHFKPGSIETTDVPDADMLIALHACDTATDQAIYRGISGGAKVIICAPCCHKQIRKQMKPAEELKPLARYGILEERQAEILTDTIRALVLEAYGYKTNVFEFISTEHTPKNVLIVGVKQDNTTEGLKEEALKQIADLKVLYGIKQHELEKLMGL